MALAWSIAVVSWADASLSGYLVFKGNPAVGICGKHRRSESCPCPSEVNGSTPHWQKSRRVRVRVAEKGGAPPRLGFVKFNVTLLETPYTKPSTRTPLFDRRYTLIPLYCTLLVRLQFMLYYGHMQPRQSRAECRHRTRTSAGSFGLHIW